MERLIRLYEEFGQSPWLDNLKRGYLTSGQLATLRDGGIRGLTSNPTIFQKAIADSADYDEQFKAIANDKTPIVDDYWALVTKDIHGACDVFDPLYESSDGGDGFVSVEVGPVARPRRAGHRGRRPPPPHHDRPPQPDGEDPRDRRGRGADPGDAERRPQHQRHADLQPRALPGGHGGLPRRARDLCGDIGRRPVEGRQRGQLLHLPRRHRGRSPARCDRVAGGAGAARQGRRRPGQAGLPRSSARRSADRAGRRWRRRALACSARCGPARRPRTRPTPTRCTSTS